MLFFFRMCALQRASLMKVHLQYLCPTLGSHGGLKALQKCTCLYLKGVGGTCTCVSMGGGRDVGMGVGGWGVGWKSHACTQCIKELKPPPPTRMIDTV